MISDLPGGTSLTWTDDAGAIHNLLSQQLNQYLANASGSDHVTARTFRTWAGTLAAYKVAEAGGASIKGIASAAAGPLHNTPTVARNSYIHPNFIDLADGTELAIESMNLNGLFAAEQRLMGFLQTG